MRNSIFLLLVCVFISSTSINAQSIIKDPNLSNNYERPSPPQNCQVPCPVKYYVDECFEEDFNSFVNHNYYNAYSAFNETSCSCINSIQSAPINTSLMGNYDEDVTLVNGLDEIISYLTQSGSDDTNPFGNPIGLSLSRHNGGNKGLRLNTVPDKINIYSEQEFANVSIYTIDFKSQDITNVSFDFATVFEYWDKNDHNHPYFKASIIAIKDCTKETVIDSRCINPESPFVQFQQLNKPPPNNIPNPDPYYIDKIRYSDWTTMSFDIPTAYLNSRLQLRLEVGDCDGETVSGGFTSLHAGYAYIDNISTCSDDNPCPNPCKIIPAFTESINGCTVTFDGTNNGNVCPQQTYEWTVNGSIVSTSEDFTYTFPQSGTYNVCFSIRSKDGMQQCIETTCKTITVNCNPPEPCPSSTNIFYMNEGGGGTCSTGQASISGINASEVDYVNWTWALGGYSGTGAGTGTTTPIYYPSGDWTNYYISICATVVYKSGKVCPQVCKSFLLDCGEGIGNQRNTNLKLYPNPLKSNQELEFDGVDFEDIKKIEVLDLLGNLKSQFKPKSAKFNIGQLTSGIYFVKFYTVKGIEQKKIIIE